MLKNKTIFKSIAVALIMFMMVAALSPSVRTVEFRRLYNPVYYTMQGDTLCLVKDIDDNLQGESPLYSISERSTATSVNFMNHNAGAYTFTDFTALTSVDFSTLGSNGISEGIFKGCTSLASIAVSSNITSIGAYAFADCASLTSITYDGTKEQWNAITKGEGWDSNTGDYTITCSDGTIAKSDALSGSVDTGSGESGNNPPAQPSEGQTVTGSNGATGTTDVNYEVDQTGWTFSVPAAQEFTKENLVLYGYASINPESGKDIISLPSGQTINMTFTAANFNDGVFELRNGSNSVIPYTIGRVSMVASEGEGNNEIIENITSNGCSVLTYMAGSSANTGVTNKLRFATTLENIKNAKVTGLHTDTLTFTVNVTSGT